jgi:hypothetical protein
MMDQFGHVVMFKTYLIGMGKMPYRSLRNLIKPEILE